MWFKAVTRQGLHSGRGVHGPCGPDLLPLHWAALPVQVAHGAGLPAGPAGQRAGRLGGGAAVSWVGVWWCGGGWGWWRELVPPGSGREGLEAALK